MANTFTVELERLDGYRFRTDFHTEGVPPLEVDEPPPLGANAGPSPARLLATAVGDCLAASLLFALSKLRVEVLGLKARVEGHYVRNERKLLRIGGLDVTLALDTRPEDADKVQRALGMYEDFCAVTAVARGGTDVRVTVTDAAGRELAAAPVPE